MFMRIFVFVILHFLRFFKLSRVLAKRLPACGGKTTFAILQSANSVSPGCFRMLTENTLFPFFRSLSCGILICFDNILNKLVPYNIRGIEAYCLYPVYTLQNTYCFLQS